MSDDFVLAFWGVEVPIDIIERWFYTWVQVDNDDEVEYNETPFEHMRDSVIREGVARYYGLPEIVMASYSDPQGDDELHYYLALGEVERIYHRYQNRVYTRGSHVFTQPTAQELNVFRTQLDNVGLDAQTISPIVTCTDYA